MKDRNTEIREAIDAGNRAMDALDEALGHLKTARGLGIWDMLGGGFFSSFLKHSKMDDAQRAKQYAQQERCDPFSHTFSSYQYRQFQSLYRIFCHSVQFPLQAVRTRAA
mgnify:CR=1 FL=1